MIEHNEVLGYWTLIARKNGRYKVITTNYNPSVLTELKNLLEANDHKNKEPESYFVSFRYFQTCVEGYQKILDP